MHLGAPQFQTQNKKMLGGDGEVRVGGFEGGRGGVRGGGCDVYHKTVEFATEYARSPLPIVWMLTRNSCNLRNPAANTRPDMSR